jgi:hypothetical protein
LTSAAHIPARAWALALALAILLVAATPASGDVVINEIESEGVVDFVELTNSGVTAVDISGYLIDDSADGSGHTIPNGTTLSPGGYYVNSDLALGVVDSARLFSPSDPFNPVDSYEWTSHAPTTYGRCPNGTGEIAVTVGPTPGAANDCLIIEDKCVVPKIAKGSSRKKVNTKLTEANCALGKATKKFSATVKRGKLIKLKIEAGTELDAGAEVPAVFSKGKRPR